jgi:hypothetical protein
MQSARALTCWTLRLWSYIRILVELKFVLLTVVNIIVVINVIEHNLQDSYVAMFVIVDL